VNDFEEMFGDFVKSFGGEVLPEFKDAPCADYLFRNDNIVAELKTMERDMWVAHATKVQALFDNWMRRGLIRGYGRVQIHLPTLPQVCQREWLDVLEPPVESLLRSANRQIRSTKERLSLDSGIGLLLIANEGNLLHTAPVEYMTLVARMLQKRTPTGEPKYPHLRGVVYFSYRIRSRPEGLPFWAAGVVDPLADGALSTFQKKLRRDWLTYLSNHVGQPVAEHIVS
jgi:hypothetical protein